MTNDLLPCPFCGSTDIKIEHTHTPSFWAKCQECDCEVDGEYFPSPRQRNKRYIYNPDIEKSEGFYAKTVKELPPEYQQSYQSAVKAWNTRTPNKPAEVDLDALKREALAKPTVYKKGSVHEAEIFADRERTVEFTIRQLNDVFAAIEDIRNVMTLVPDSYRDYSPGLYKAIDDLLAASGHLATGKGGDEPAAPTQIDAGDRRHEYKPHKKHPQFCDVCGYAEHETLQHLSKLSGCDAQQSDMVAVPREVIEKSLRAIKHGFSDNDTLYFEDAYDMLQPYTKGE